VRRAKRRPRRARRREIGVGQEELAGDAAERHFGALERLAQRAAVERPEGQQRRAAAQVEHVVDQPRADSTRTDGGSFSGRTR